MAIYRTALFQVKLDALNEYEMAIRKFVEYVRANEPKTLLYVSLWEKEGPTRFLHYFIFEDEAAGEHHSNSSAVNHFTSILYPNPVEPVVWEHHGIFSCLPFLCLLKRINTTNDWLWFSAARFLEFVLPIFDSFPFSYGRLITPLISLWLI